MNNLLIFMFLPSRSRTVTLLSLLWSFRIFLKSLQVGISSNYLLNHTGNRVILYMLLAYYYWHRRGLVSWLLIHVFSHSSNICASSSPVGSPRFYSAISFRTWYRHQVLHCALEWHHQVHIPGILRERTSMAPFVSWIS